MPDFLLKKTDIVPIKKTSSGGPINVSVSDIIAYGKNNNYGNSFVLYDCGNSRAGLAIRYFNVTTNTIYLATTTFLSDSSSYIGVGIYDNRYIQSPRTTLFGSTGSSISGFSVATNFLAQTVSGIQYGKNGGNLSGYGDQQAFYIDESVTTIYIDNVPYKETGTVRVNYYLPDYDYTYAKITYKKDDKPASETDGTSVEILKDQSSVDISGLEIGGNYWFTVFTDKSESEAFPYIVPVDPVPPEYKPYINEINRKAFGKTGDESFILDRNIGGTIFGVNHGYGDSFVNLSGFRIEASSNTFAVYAIPYVRIDIDFDETNNRYVATGTNLVGAVGLTGPEKNYFECVANTQKPFEIRSSFKATYNINNSISPVIAISDSVIGCLQQLQVLCCYVDIYVDGTAIDIVSR